MGTEDKEEQKRALRLTSSGVLGNQLCQTWRKVSQLFFLPRLPPALMSPHSLI